MNTTINREARVTLTYLMTLSPINKPKIIINAAIATLTIISLGVTLISIVNYPFQKIQ